MSPFPRLRLLRWYRRHRRDLPWRRTRDPYAIWVAETMLQQTRSETVLRYYPRFLARFPTIRSLARAPESAVLTVWSGLGYYSRARGLHAAARLLVREQGGRLPEDPAVIRSLPGVGRYTAGAVASIAFGRPVPLLDGNVARVFARYFKVHGTLRTPATETRLWGLAEALVRGPSPGDWNQALMELGATVCTARAPACPRCPIHSTCAAYVTGWVDRLPERAPRRASRRVRRVSVVLEHSGRVLLVRRDDGRLLRGLWEFPSVALDGGASAETAVRDELRRLGAGRPPVRPHGKVVHAIMNQRIENQIFLANLRRRKPPRRTGTRWARPRDLERLPVSAAGLRILAALGGSAQLK